MLTHLGPLHAIAARRGDGLRPELARLLSRDAEALCTAPGETIVSEDGNTEFVRFTGDDNIGDGSTAVADLYKRVRTKKFRLTHYPVVVFGGAYWIVAPLPFGRMPWPLSLGSPLPSPSPVPCGQLGTQQIDEVIKNVYTPPPGRPGKSGVPPYAWRPPSRHDNGKGNWYYRRGSAYIALRGELFSPDWWADYKRAAQQAKRRGRQRKRPAVDRGPDRTAAALSATPPGDQVVESHQAASLSFYGYPRLPKVTAAATKTAPENARPRVRREN